MSHRTSNTSPECEKESTLQNENSVPPSVATVCEPKRVNYPFVQHKKTPYLARRAKPNPEKKDGCAGLPIPFGSWYVYQTIDGKDYRFSLRTEVHEEAKQKYHNWLSKLQHVSATKGSLSSLLPGIIQRRKATHKSEGSLGPLLNAQKRLLRGCPFMKTEYSDLTNLVVLEQWNEFVATGRQDMDDGNIEYNEYSLNTLQTDYYLLRSAVRLAEKMQCVPPYPDLMENVVLEDADNTCPQCVKKLTAETFHKIRWHMYNGNGNRHPHTPIVFDVYWMSGGRRSSVADIHTEDVNFQTGWLFFRTAKGRPKGYSMPMSHDLQMLLKEHIERYEKKPGEKLFDVGYINVSIARACELAGWEHMHPHDFRHLFACNALQRTKNIILVSLWLGHTDGGILAAKVYATTRDEESLRNMRQNMTFLSRAWSSEGLSLIRTRIQNRLNDIAAHVATAPTQQDLEASLMNLKDLMENPLAATGTDSSLVLAQNSVLPTVIKHIVLEGMVEWITQNPAVPAEFIERILTSKFPDATNTLRRRALFVTADVRKAATKAATEELHQRLVAYLIQHPSRYIGWLNYDFPEATKTQINRAVLAIYGSLKKPQSVRDSSCPMSKRALRIGVKERRFKAVLAMIGDPQMGDAFQSDSIPVISTQYEI
jgi:hypothetical protein